MVKRRKRRILSGMPSSVGRVGGEGAVSRSKRFGGERERGLELCIEGPSSSLT